MTSNLGSAEMYREHSAAVARRKQQQLAAHQDVSPESLEVVDKERMKEVVMEQVRGHAGTRVRWHELVHVHVLRGKVDTSV